MARYLLAATPQPGHVVPVLGVAAGLAGRGHDVSLLTGSRFARQVEAAGVHHLPLPEACDYDDRALDARFPERVGKQGLAQVKLDLRRIFIDCGPPQLEALDAVLGDPAVDGVVADVLFLGALALALRPRDRRPPVLALGVTPVAAPSRDTAPFGLGLPPVSPPLGPLRNRLLNVVVARALRGVSRHVERTLVAQGLPPLPSSSFLEAGYTVPDAVAQLTVDSFEYPRSDLAGDLRFVGPIVPRADPDAGLPAWWSDLDGRRPVVHVTQGTVDTGDPGRLILPTVRALADDDVLVVVTTGGPPVTSLGGDLPANVRAERFLPHAHLLPKVSVMVTNGGYGGVNTALAHGVPLVVGGRTEDKIEVAARVAWSGVGINLRSATPKAAAVGAAVRRVLAEARFVDRARVLAREIGATDAVASVDDLLSSLARGA